MVQNQMRDATIDLEIGGNAVVSEDDNSKNLLIRVWDGFGSCDDLSNGNSNKGESGDVSAEKKIMKGFKKPPKPPRPPRAPSASLDAADQKLIREINELAMMKRARIERMKALKRMKNAKTGSSSGNLVPWVITMIFCILILWQGVFSRGRSSLRFHGSPESSVGARGGFISVQFYNASAARDSRSTSPNNVERVSGIDDNHGESRAAE